MRLKYVMFLVDDAKEVPVLFPEHFAHKDFERLRRSQYAHWFMAVPVSAGFVSISAQVIGGARVIATASGESESLKLKSRPEDSDILTKMLNGELH